MRKGRSPIFHCHQKQAHKKEDHKSRITNETQVARDRKNILGDEYTWDLFRMFQLCL